jgi:hypothetical protein
MTGRPEREPSLSWNPASNVCCGPRVPSRQTKNATSGAGRHQALSDFEAVTRRVRGMRATCVGMAEARTAPAYSRPYRPRSRTLYLRTDH